MLVSDAVDAVQALQESGYPPTARAVAWLLTGGGCRRPRRSQIDEARATLRLAEEQGRVVEAGAIPTGARPATYYHVVEVAGG